MKSLVIAALLGAGCAHLSAGAQSAIATTVAVGRDVLTCSNDEAESVRRALTNGGWDWLTVVIDAIKCVPQIVKTLETPAQLASAGPMVELAPTLSKRARARIATAKVLADVVLSRVQP